MKDVRTLRQYIRFLVKEVNASNVDGPHLKDLMSSHLAQRDEIPHLGKRSKKEEDEIAPHLMEPEETPEDCWGPVPPNEENRPGVFIDPFTQDFHVLPRKPVNIA